MSKHFLTKAQAFELMTAIKRDQERLETVGGTHEGFAKQYSDELGFRIQIANFKACLKALGITTKRRWSKSAGSPTKDRLARIELFLEKVYGPKFSEFIGPNGDGDGEA